ncbi:cysteine--tRNA ligase [bacterium]|nr:cysteine--tRNA ligase [bacterium]MBU1064911.1 cysteine--tRNA ligase [bacterium]MBU1634155.1 cysteine--tRNA ligase [bacterium]MBU1874258.1 cysteine--tRNA ligase [bacterium]
MALRFYNTMTRNKDDFQPIQTGKVRMYTCGPTVYNYAHIGNFRAYIFEDLLRRYLKFKGYQVVQVMNITDVDDKIIRDANKTGKSIREFTKSYQDAFFEDLDALGIERAEVYPAATDHIPEMVNLIKSLLDKGIAYRTDDGSIYFRVSDYPAYGKLAHLNIAEMQRGARVQSDEYEKEEIRDFALWKGWKDDDGPVYWETEIGKGRPGWHIECSAMSSKYLGKHFDIHTGGVDNIFPHHENEIAQSEAGTGEKFVNYWLHCEHLMVEGDKMSKSAGNFYRLRELLDKEIDATAIRYVLLSTHYRQKLNFTFDKVEAAAKSITRLRDFKKSLIGNTINDSQQIRKIIDKYLNDFEATLDDDLNISGALGSVFSCIHEINTFRETNSLTEDDVQAIVEYLNRIDSVLNVLEVPENQLSDEEQTLIDARQQARAERNWAEADRIRDELLSRGIILEDTPQGTSWKRKI